MSSGVYELLQNTTARVLYFSCLSAPRTIPEIAKFWGYKSAAYFYQSNSRSLLRKMVDSTLIMSRETGKGREQLSSNLEIVLEKSGLSSFFSNVNTNTEIKLVMEQHPEIREGQLSDPSFREYCLSREPEINQRARRLRFDGDAVRDMENLWTQKSFSKLFIPIEALSKALDRYFLPGDPKELLFEVTCALCEEMFEWEKGKVILIPPFMNLFLTFDITEMLPAILDKLDAAANPLNSDARKEFHSVATSFVRVYETLMRRIAAYEEIEDIRSYHIRRFLSLIGLKERSSHRG